MNRIRSFLAYILVLSMFCADIIYVPTAFAVQSDEPPVISGEARQAPRDLNTLRALDGIEFDDNGNVVSVRTTDDNMLTREEVNLLLTGKAEPTQPFTPYYGGYLQLGLTEDDVNMGIRLHGDANAFSMEITSFKTSAAAVETDDELEESILKLICSGYTNGQAFSAYASSSVLGMTIDELADIRKEEIEEELAKAEIKQNSPIKMTDYDDEDDKNADYLELSTSMGVPYSVVETYMESYAGNAAGLKAESKAAKENVFVASATSTVRSNAAGAQQGGLQSGGSMSSSTSSSNDPVYYPDAVLEKPYAYDKVGNVDVNVNTGDYSYTETDLHIPGINGLDLNISRRFDTQYSNPNMPHGYFYRDNSVYSVVVRYLWFIESVDANGLVQYIDVTNQGYTLISPNNSIANYTEYFSSAEWEYARNAYFYFDMAYSTGAWSPWGEGVSLLLVPAIYGISPYYEDLFYSIAQPYNYTVDEFGLGHGWRLGFSAIETYGSVFLEDYDFVYKKRLITADGRRYEIKSTIGSNISAQESNLVDYPLLDMRLFATGNGYTGAAYSLFHADGRIEYFNSDGRNIAIVDRFGNEITLSYTYKDSSRKTVTQIQITDTLGNDIVYKNENIDINTEVYESNYRYRYNTEWTLSLNDSVIRTYYTHDYRSSSSQNLKNQGYVRLTGVVDEVGDSTAMVYAGGQRNFDVFTMTSYDNGVWRVRENYIGTIYYPSDLEIRIGRSGSRRARVGECGFIERSNRFSVEYWDRVSSEDSHGSKKEYVIGNYSGYSAPRQETEYYTVATESKHRYFYWPNGDEYIPCILDFKRDIYTFSSDKHLKKKMETRQYNHVDEFSLITNADVDAYWSSTYLLSKEIEETYEYHSTYELPTQIKRANYNPGSPSTPAMTSIYNFTYDNKGNILTSQSPNQETTTYTYHATYNLPLTVSYRKDNNTTIKKTNTLSGNNKSITVTTTTKNNVPVEKTEYEYASDGSLTAQKNYSDANTYVRQEFSYDSVSALPTVIKTLNVKDVDGNLVTGSPSYASGVIATSTVYNARGWPESVTDAAGNTTAIQYDGTGRVTRVTNPDESFARYWYDVAGLTVTHRDELGNIFLHSYDRSGNRLTTVDSASGDNITSAQYDFRGNVYKETVHSSTGNDKHTYYCYDNFARLIEVSVKTGGGTVTYKETYEYQYVNDLLKVTKTVHGDANSPSIITTQYTDKMGNVVKTGKMLNGEYTDTYTYDYLGNLLTERTAYTAGIGGSVSNTYTYDHAGRVLSAKNALSQTSSMTYDWLGNMLTESDHSNRVTSYDYDELGRLLEAQRPFSQSGSTTKYAVSQYAYDPTGNVVSEKTANNAPDAARTWAQTDYAYNDRGKLVTVTDRKSTRLNSSH